MATPNIVPRADSEGGIGTATKYWASAYIDLIYLGAGKIGRDADNLIDFSVDNNIVFKVNGVSELQLNATEFFPYASNGLSLGNSGRMWSDLFLASGAVINFDNGNVTLTHSANALTLADGDKMQFGAGSDLQVFHDGTNSHIDNYVGAFSIIQRAADGALSLQCDDSSGGVTAYITLDGNVGYTIASKTIRVVDNQKIQLGGSGDLNILHDATDSWIINDTGDLYIRNSVDDKDIIFQSDDGSGGTTAYITLDGSSVQTKFHKNTEHQDSVLGGYGNGMDLQLQHNATDSYIDNYTGDLYFRDFADDKDIIFQSDNGAGGVATYFYLDGSSAEHNGSATTALYTNWPDNSRISLGTSHDLQLEHTSADSVIRNATGDLYIQQNADDKDIIFQASTGSANPATYLTLDGSSGFTKLAASTQHGDSVLGCYGAENDLQLQHDGTNSSITNATGDLTISNVQDDGDIIFKSDDGSGGVAEYFRLDGGTTSIIASKNLELLDDVELKIGTGNDLNIRHNGDNSFIQSQNGDLTISNSANDKNIIFQTDDGSGGLTAYLTLNGYTEQVLIAKPTLLTSTLTVGVDDTGHDVKFFGATSGKFLQWDESADTLFLTDNTNITFGNGNDATIGVASDNLVIKNDTADKDIIFQCDDGSGGVAEYLRLDGGASIIVVSKEMRFADNIKLKLGSGPDLEIYHDGSNSYIAEIGTGLLNIFSNGSGISLLKSTGENMGLFKTDGAVELYHDNAKKFETTATGISVTGATGTTEGGGIDATDAVSIQVGEINGEIITTIFVDIGIGSIQSSSTNTGAIGNGTDAAAYITRVTTAINGIVYKVELICVEAPTVASGALSADIDLTANSSSIASGSAVSGSPICNSAGDHALGRFVRSADSTTNTITPDDYLYLAQGTTNAGVYNAGKFLIRLFGAKTTGL